jgi:23S rRNA pseudouridine1911/1915/1917 synthase
MAFHGFPLWNDPLYGRGGTPKENKEMMDREGRYPVPGDCGYLLHSWKISFPHPDELQTIEIECPPPATLAPY